MLILDSLARMTRGPRYKAYSKTFKLFASTTELANLKGSYCGFPMIIVGNGPSLNLTPLDRFMDVPSIGLNKIDLIFPRTAWRPTMIVCNNLLVAKQHKKNFERSEIPIFLSWQCRPIMWQKTGRVNYFNTDLSNEFSHDITQRVGASGTVTYSALQFAYFMGANPVILFGVDHSFVIKGRNNEIQKREGQDINHFDPNYFSSGSYWGLPNLDKSEIGYANAKIMFEQDGREVLDASINGKLQVFPKITLDEAISRVQRCKQ